jgi:katanin p80 WD40 repeat-containing subunit B1
VGKPNCIMSLTGHSSPVESVRFGHTEESVCAGSQAGTLKIWDLEAARLVRTHTGQPRRSCFLAVPASFWISGILNFVA